MPLSLQGATSGTVTMTVPAVAGTNTVTVPAATGTLLIDVGNQSTTGTMTANNFINTGAFYENALTVSSNYSIGAGRSAMSTGPITISSGVTVTIPSGSKWVVL